MAIDKNIRYDPKNIGYVIAWHDDHSMEGEGITVFNNIEDLVSKIKHPRYQDEKPTWLSHSPPRIKVFKNLGSFLGEKNSRWIRFPSDLPESRALTDQERDMAFEAYRLQMFEEYNPEILSYLLRMFAYKDNGCIGDY